MPFVTSPSQKAKLKLIVQKMFKSSLDLTFINKANSLASFDQGVFDLLEMWYEGDTEALSDIQKSIKDYEVKP